MKTIKCVIKATESAVRLARQAYEAQNACNGCGLSHDFREAFKALLNDSPNFMDGQQRPSGGSDYTNQHPVIVLWIDKFASLAGCQDLGNERVGDAYEAVRGLMEGRDVEWEFTER